ncbi:MAG: DUF4157 domain-containing protein [Methanothrix sp.]|nr:DUF4157 domain-containing protein [Methanothrix sp.]
MGNQAVQRMLQTRIIQAKLAVSEPGDRYEQEADRVADQVMRMPEPHLQRQVEPEEEEEKVQTKLIRDQITPLVQRQAESEEEDEEKVQTKLISDQFTPLIQRQVEPEEEEEKVQTKLIGDQFTPLIQRQIEPEEEDEEKIQAKLFSGQTSLQIQRDAIPEKYIQRKRMSRPVQDSGANSERKIQSLKGRGQLLPESINAFFRPRLGYDFSKVRIHSGASATEAALAVNARAFTVGQDIVFAPGQYAPGTFAGRRLLAHELTHVIQQNKGQAFEINYSHIRKSSSTSVISRLDKPIRDGISSSTPVESNPQSIHSIGNVMPQIQRNNESETEEPEAQEAETTFGEPYEGYNALRDRSNELEGTIEAIEMEYAQAIVDEDFSWETIMDFKRDIALCKREKLLVDTFSLTALHAGGLREDVEIVLRQAYNASQREEDTLLALQGEEGAPGNISEIVTDVLLTMPDLFPDYTVGLYISAVEEFSQLSESYRQAFESDLDGLTQRPAEEIIPDFIWMMQNREELLDQAALISFLNYLDSETPIFLERREPNSTSIEINNIRVRLNEYHMDWAQYLHPDLEETLAFLYPALENWNFYQLYEGFTLQMDLFRNSVESTMERLNMFGSAPDVVADIERTYSSYSPQVGPETRREGFDTIYDRMEIILDAWVSSLTWDQKILEGFGLYDILNEMRTQIKGMITLEAIAMMVGFVAFLYAIQYVPYANIVVDALLIGMTGTDFLKGTVIFGWYFDEASEAASFRNLYSAAQHLQGGGEAVLNLLLELVGLAARGAISSYARYRNVRRFSSLDEIANDDIIRQGGSRVRRDFNRAQEFGRHPGLSSWWDESINPETRQALEANEDLWQLYANMNPRTRRLLTHCGSFCVPIGASAEDCSRIDNFLHRMRGLREADEWLLREFFYARRQSLGDAITEVERAGNMRQLHSILQRSASERARAQPTRLPSALRGPGEDLRNPGQLYPGRWGDAELPGSAYGHSYSEHGPTHGKNRTPQQMADRAAAQTRRGGEPVPNGQWYNSDLIVEAERRANLENAREGPGGKLIHIFDMGRPIGRVYMPDGSVISDVTRVKVIRNPNGTLDTSFPIN